MHEPGTSHFDLLRAFAEPPVLERAHAHAEAMDYLRHELGDFTLYALSPSSVQISVYPGQA